ncbi:hypothetical protein J6590_068978 [Homalodisca vitripennis]|nr:hypothetical protein J6590_068978 [Homalodisca vitripennis]
MAHQNIDGIKNKIERLTHFLHSHNPTILILTERGLNSANLENIRIPEYELIGGFTRTQHKKGGVAIFNENLKSKVSIVSISDSTTEMICECITLKINLKNCFLYLVGVYRPPHSNLENAIDTLSTELDKIPNPNNPIVIMGDINVDNLTVVKKAKA